MFSNWKYDLHILKHDAHSWLPVDSKVGVEAEPGDVEGAGYIACQPDVVNPEDILRPLRMPSHKKRKPLVYQSQQINILWGLIKEYLMFIQKM